MFHAFTPLEFAPGNELGPILGTRFGVSALRENDAGLLKVEHGAFRLNAIR